MPKHRWILFLIDVQREGQPLRILGHYLSLMLGSTGKGSRLLDCLILLCYVSKETVTWKNRHWRQNYGFYFFSSVQFSSVHFSHSVVSDSLRPHESQHARPPCPSPTPGVYSDSRPSSPWCHPAISSSVVPFSSCPQSLPASESFPMSPLFTWGGQSTGVSALASFLPKKSQGWSPSE